MQEVNPLLPAPFHRAENTEQSKLPTFKPGTGQTAMRASPVGTNSTVLPSWFIQLHLPPPLKT